MAVASALLRLLRVRALEEEQQRLALELELSQLRALENALAAARVRMRQGEALLASVGSSIEIADRRAALVEIDAAHRRVAALLPRIRAAQESADRARQEYLARRLERRQVETLIDEARAKESVESIRRSQQSSDESFGSRRHRRQRDAVKRQDSE